jgi:ABC-type oligopeptide transport system ATPase subunit
MGELLRTTALHRQFRMGDTVVRAVDGIDLSVGEGEFVSIMGPSGCGKSTLLYLLGGLDRPTGGEIHLSGRRVDRLSRTRWARLRRRQIGFVFQTASRPAKPSPPNSPAATDPSGRARTLLDASSIWSDRVRSRRIVWMISRMIKRGRHFD